MPLRKISIKPPQPKTTTTAATTTSNLKEELLKWICERHATNGPLDRQLLRDKALELATSLGVTGFKCSEAWLTVFLKKHGFSPSLTNCSGPTFPDYRVWIDLLRSLITQYRHKDLFNVDELRMYSDFLPSRVSSPTTQSRNQHGDGVGEKNPERPLDPSSRTNRIGMLMCCNSSGTEKLRPLISAPYEVKNSRRDCRYHSDEDSCITDDLFGEWLAELNEQMSKADRRILLLLGRDRIRSLQSTPRLSNVSLLFFPKDFPAHLRPLRGDVFHCAKMIYRGRYVERIRSEAGQWGPEEIVESAVRAWEEVPQELLVSSFQRTKFREDESFLKIECPAWDDLRTGISFRRFVTFDDDLSDSSGNIPDDLKFLRSNNGHRYNLRRSRRETVDLDVIEEIDSTKATRAGRAPKRSADRETGSRPEAPSDRRDQGSSGNKKRKIAAEEGQDDRRESENSRSSKSSSSNEEAVGQGLAERIEDYLDNVTDPTVEEDDSVSDSALEASGANKNQENVDNLISEMCGRSEKTRGLMERCLRTVSAGNRVSDFTDEDIRGVERSPEGDSVEEGDSGPDDNEQLGARCTKRGEENAKNFPGEAGPSGEGLGAGEGTSGFENPPEVAEFDDEEEQIPIARQLTLKIIEAIECCDEIERSNVVDINLLEAGDGDDNPRTSKRTRDRPDDDDDDDEDDDEPAEKRARPDGSWSKRYEKNFVFGPELRETSSQSVEASTDDQPLRSHEVVTKSKKTQTRSSELEKRCIFTLDGNAPGVSFPKD